MMATGGYWGFPGGSWSQVPPVCTYGRIRWTHQAVTEQDPIGHGHIQRRTIRETGEPRWPMALAVLVAGALHAVLPTELRQLPPELLGDSRWWYLVVVTALLGALIVGDPGRIDRESNWLRAMTVFLIVVISADNLVRAGV